MKFLFLAEEVADATTTTSQTPTLQDFVNKIIDWCQTSGLKLLIGLVALFIIFKIINFIANKVRKGMLKKNRDATITNVVYQCIRKISKVVVFILFLGYVGIDTAGIGSIIASLAVAIGLALQGSLANIAGWFIIIVMRPFKLGDYIVCQGQEGYVEDIKLFYTYLVSFDNKVVMIPNGALANGNITNLSMKNKRRVDLEFLISYENNTNDVINLINSVINSYGNVDQDPAPFVKVLKCDEKGTTLAVRAWCDNGKYWDVYFDLINNIKAKFDENNVIVPITHYNITTK